MDGNDSSEPQNAEPPGYPSSTSAAVSALTDPGGAATDEFKQLVDNINKGTVDIGDQHPRTDELLSATASTPSSETNGNASDQGSAASKTTGTQGTTKSALTAKRSFKPQSLNGIFRQLQATSVVVKTSSEKSTTSSIPHQSSQTNLNAARLRVTPKLSTSAGAFTLAPLRRDLSISPRPGSAGLQSGPGSGPRTTTQHVWNKGQVPPAGQKSHKEFSEEELKKLGIHLTESIAAESKETKWADDDDDDDWGDTIEFGDGTKVVLSHDHESPSLSKDDIAQQLQERAQSEEASQIVPAGSPHTLAQASNESSHQLATQPPTHSPWAPIPHVQPSLLLTKIADGEKSESHHNIHSREAPHFGSSFSRNEEPGRQNYHHHAPDHDVPPYGSQDARNQPIVLPRDRFSDMDFDRSYGPRPSGQGGELFNDRSGQMESVRRRSFNSRRPPPPPPPQQKVIGIMARTGRQEFPLDDRDPLARRGSSSVSSSGRRRSSLSRPSEDEVSVASGRTPSDDQGSQPRSAGQSPSMVFSQMHHGDSDYEPGRRPPHITAQQELIMKHSIENARKRKEEEQRREQERLEAARKRAEEIVRKKHQEQERRQREQQKEEEPLSQQQLPRDQEQPQQMSPQSQKRQESQPKPIIEHNEIAVVSSPEAEHADSVRSAVAHDAAKSRRKQSSASSDGAEGMDASVTAAIEFLISEPAAGQSPPVSRAITKPTAPQGVPGSGWDNARSVMNRGGSWSRNGLNDGSRGPPYVRSLVNGNDNVWGPVGSRSRYPAIDGVGNGAVDAHSFLSGPGNVPNAPADWGAKPNTPAQLSENWRRPFAPQKDPTARAPASAPVGPPGSSSAIHAPVGTPIPSPVKGNGSVGQSSPSSNLSYEGKPNDDGLGLSGTGVPSASSASSSRLLSRFFPSGMPHRVDSIGAQLSSSSTIGTMLTGLTDEMEGNRYTADQDNRVMDNYLLLSQSVHSLSDDSSSLRPKVHLPPVSPKVRLPPAEPDTRSNNANYVAAYSPEIASSQSPSHILSPSLGSGTIDNDMRDQNGGATAAGLGYFGGKVPSIGAIEAVQSRIAMTLGAHADGGKLLGSKQQSPTSSPVMSQPQIVLSPIRKPTTILRPPKLAVTSVEPLETQPGDEDGTQYQINLAEYPQSYTLYLPKKSMLDSFQLTKKIPGNFVGAISAAVSSASPASNPFNPQRRGGGSSAYKIMLPGLHEHILIPVNMSGAAIGGTGSHYSSRRGGESREWSRRGGPSKHS
ncbi:hypothetical protein V1504DRAFT_467922 [Lipomyces starkeyi]